MIDSSASLGGRRLLDSEIDDGELVRRLYFYISRSKTKLSDNALYREGVGHRTAGVREASWIGLAKGPAAEFREHFERALTHKKASVRASAAKCAVYGPGRSLVSIMQTALQREKSKTVRQALDNALAELAPRPAPAAEAPSRSDAIARSSRRRRQAPDDRGFTALTQPGCAEDAARRAAAGRRPRRLRVDARSRHPRGRSWL